MIFLSSKNIKKEDIFYRRMFSGQIRDKAENLLQRENNDEIILFFKNAYSGNLDNVNLNILSNQGVIYT